MRTALAALTATALLAPAAPAATPDSGRVSLASPRVEWTGTLQAGYLTAPAVTADGQATPCLPGTCDSFALEVADSADVILSADGPAEATVTLRVTDPRGEVTVSSGPAAPGRPHRLAIPAAAAGAYRIEYFNSAVTASLRYAASAQLLVPVDPASGPPPVAEQAPAEWQSFVLRVRTRTTPARRRARSRRLPVRIAVNREARRVFAVLKNGPRTIGRAGLRQVSGTAKLSLRLRRPLRPGIRYLLVVEAVDHAGIRTGKARWIRVRR